VESEKVLAGDDMAEDSDNDDNDDNEEYDSDDEVADEVSGHVPGRLVCV
jgi:hypothetical protein